MTVVGDVGVDEDCGGPVVAICLRILGSRDGFGVDCGGDGGGVSGVVSLGVETTGGFPNVAVIVIGLVVFSGVAVIVTGLVVVGGGVGVCVGVSEVVCSGGGS